jgi:transposase-like protein
MTVPTSPKRPRYAFCSKQSADGSEANEVAIKGYNEEHGITISIRQVKYLKNGVDQKHRAVKRVPRPMWGGKSFETAPSILTGIAQVQGVVVV